MIFEYIVADYLLLAVVAWRKQEFERNSFCQVRMAELVWGFGKICSSCWKTEIVQNLLALSSFVWDYLKFQTHPETSTTVINRKSLWKCLSGARDIFSLVAEFIYCIEQPRLPKCISPVGARASSDTLPVPVILSPQHAKTVGFHLYIENTLEYHWTLILYSPLQLWNHSWLASELFLSV